MTIPYYMESFLGLNDCSLEVLGVKTLGNQVIQSGRESLQPKPCLVYMESLSSPNISGT